MSFLEDVVNVGTGGISDAVGITNKKKPPAPDIAGNELANSRAARETARLNNPNIINQYGTQTYTQDENGNATLNQTLSPEQLALYNSNTANQQSSADIYGRGLGSMQNMLGQPMDLNGMPANPEAFNPQNTFDPNKLPPMPGSGEQTRQRVIDAMMSRSNDALGQREEQVKSDLIAKGLQPGTEAYKREMDSIGRQRNDAYQQAELAGGQAATQQFGMDLQGRQQGAGEQAQQFGQELSGQAQQFGQGSDLRKQAISEALMQRQQPLNELNALRSGAQQANPMAGQGFQGGANVGSTAGQMDAYNTNVYNQQTASNNALIGGATGLGQAYIKSQGKGG